MPKGQDPFANKNSKFATFEMVVQSPYQYTNFALIGLTNGYVWVIDTKVNQFLYSAKVLDHAVRNIWTSKARILVEGE